MDHKRFSGDSKLGIPTIYVLMNIGSNIWIDTKVISGVQFYLYIYLCTIVSIFIANKLIFSEKNICFGLKI